MSSSTVCSSGVLGRTLEPEGKDWEEEMFGWSGFSVPPRTERLLLVCPKGDSWNIIDLGLALSVSTKQRGKGWFLGDGWQSINAQRAGSTMISCNSLLNTSHGSQLNSSMSLWTPVICKIELKNPLKIVFIHHFTHKADWCPEKLITCCHGSSQLQNCPHLVEPRSFLKGQFVVSLHPEGFPLDSTLLIFY